MACQIIFGLTFRFAGTAGEITTNNFLYLKSNLFPMAASWSRSKTLGTKQKVFSWRIDSRGNLFIKRKFRKNRFPRIDKISCSHLDRLCEFMLAGVTLKFNELMVNFQTGNVVVEPKEEERYIEDASALQKKIESLPQVVGTSARLKTTGNFRYKEKEIGATVYGIDPADEIFVTGLEDAIISGEFLSRPDKGEIILGREVSGGFGALMFGSRFSNFSVVLFNF